MSTPRALKPLRNPAYRWLAAALVSSLIGSGIWMVALVWQIIAIGGGAAERGDAEEALYGRVLRDGRLHAKAFGDDGCRGAAQAEGVGDERLVQELLSETD